ncbi:MAG: glycosyl transferase, partial [Acaryochloridaceae cyanobacterium CSU_3_4]|nr:glycosyl transferase [Acaryochloridaceae cyanobacterium CSU_3_4]
VKEFTDRDWEEQRRCEFANQYYDEILMHSDPAIHRLEDNISRVGDLKIPIHYTGYVVQSEPQEIKVNVEDVVHLNDPTPKIVVSVGGGKLGHDLLESMIRLHPFSRQKFPIA